MFGRNYTGRGRGGGGMGFGFQGSSPPWPYVGQGRGGLPRCGYYFGSTGSPAPWSSRPQPYSPRMTREEELNYLKDQAGAIKGQLEEIESRMRDLEVDK